MTALAPGFHDVPDGHIATIVTHLEMRAKPAPRPEAPCTDLTLGPLEARTPESYRALFRLVGADWLWQSRLAMGDPALAAILGDPGVEIRVLRRGSDAVGLLEIDRRDRTSVEIAFFALVAPMQGTGAGRWMMNRALDLAWATSPARVWVHTCTLDHPAAPAFYRRSGFVVTRQEVEVLADPRLAGLLPRDAAPHIPLFD
ncbi:GNAT family N-acetyltransferase [uncultured Jannaschia sp.]|uniref:GNAT family N-acetyltransferase n=1 Tax=uncultured Jannaschia sp. TaxID=293347 RepID=UPI002609A978|nr:GNAT family N-acetyltransferase [uncultured Jannaschia sp.]